MNDFITERRKNRSDVCPECNKPGFRYNDDNKVLRCAWCGHEIDAKRETDKDLLPIREAEMLMNGGY